ncbi:MAG: hypothetical protein HZA34_04635 [Candidatus Pacebacteria bacterium]|nr:hypothetical protein [Candidatus Paceibacterota bacterium]
MRKYRTYDKKIIFRALDLRRQGLSYKEILKKLEEYHIPKNTLSNWCTKAKISLDAIASGKLLAYQRVARYSAQLKGSAWQKTQKILRQKFAKMEARFCMQDVLSLQSNLSDLLFFSGFYIGEGVKCSDEHVMFANSKIEILKCCLSIFRKVFSVDESKFRIALHLRHDQNIEELEKYWSQELSIPLSQIIKSNIDQRTIGKKTFDTYKGVCAIYYYDAKIQRFLLELQEQFVLNILKKGD